MIPLDRHIAFKGGVAGVVETVEDGVGCRDGVVQCVVARTLRRNKVLSQASYARLRRYSGVEVIRDLEALARLCARLQSARHVASEPAPCPCRGMRKANTSGPAGTLGHTIRGRPLEKVWALNGVRV